LYDGSTIWVAAISFAAADELVAAREMLGMPHPRWWCRSPAIRVQVEFATRVETAKRGIGSAVARC
jgi:hypothetical protein